MSYIARVGPKNFCKYNHKCLYKLYRTKTSAKGLSNVGSGLHNQRI